MGIYKILVVFIVSDIIRNKIVLALSLFLFLVAFVLFGLEESSDKAMLSLLNVLLIVLPLVSMIFVAIHYYNSYEFLELVSSQPIARNIILISEYIALIVSLGLAIFIGVGIPLFVFLPIEEVGWLLITALTLCWTCCSVALAIAVNIRDKAKGIGAVLLTWFYFSLIYDALILLILFGFSDYPLEKLTIALIALNPIDLARISIMLKLDVSALMGYTGALFKDFYGTMYGIMFSWGCLVFWIAFPIYLATKIFSRKDF